MLHQLTNSPVPENILHFCPSAPCTRPGKRQRTYHGIRWYSLIRRACRWSLWAIRQKTGQSDTLEIASLHVKNVKTNLSSVKCLSSRFPIIFPQETWLYRYQASTLTDIFDNTELACGCVDDDAPVPTNLHMRGYVGTCILWHSSLNFLIQKLPETSVKINVVELKWPTVLFCLVNVYLPARGLAGNEILFEECLYELHEIFLIYSPTHTFVFGGEFNASLHRGDHLRRDVLFKERARITTRRLLSHTGYILSRVKDSSSQIDYFLVGPSGMRLQSTVTIPEIHHLNLFDHTRYKARYSHQRCRTSCSGLFREESHV